MAGLILFHHTLKIVNALKRLTITTRNSLGKSPDFVKRKRVHTRKSQINETKEKLKYFFWICVVFLLSLSLLFSTLTITKVYVWNWIDKALTKQKTKPNRSVDPLLSSFYSFIFLVEWFFLYVALILCTFKWKILFARFVCAQFQWITSRSAQFKLSLGFFLRCFCCCCSAFP